jgi:membrane-associated phospholipid phosphatase
MPSQLFTWFHSLSSISFFHGMSLWYAVYIPLGLIVFTALMRYWYGVYKGVKKELGLLHELSVLGIVLGATWGVAHAVKYIFQVPRPFLLFPEYVTPLLEHASYSFPSGHAAVLMALTAWMIGKNPKWFGVFLLMAALVGGVSRVIAGVHTPLDVFAGWALGYIVGHLAYKRYRIND